MKINRYEDSEATSTGWVGKMLPKYISYFLLMFYRVKYEYVLITDHSNFQVPWEHFQPGKFGLNPWWTQIGQN